MIVLQRLCQIFETRAVEPGIFQFFLKMTLVKYKILQQRITGSNLGLKPSDILTDEKAHLDKLISMTSEEVS